MIYEKTLKDFAAYVISRNYKVLSKPVQPIPAQRTSISSSNNVYSGNIVNIGYSFSPFQKSGLPYNVDVFIQDDEAKFIIEFATRKLEIEFKDDKSGSNKLYFDFWAAPSTSEFTVSLEQVKNNAFTDLIKETLENALTLEVFQDIYYALSENTCLERHYNIHNACEFTFDADVTIDDFQFELYLMF